MAIYLRQGRRRNSVTRAGSPFGAIRSRPPDSRADLPARVGSAGPVGKGASHRLPSCALRDGTWFGRQTEGGAERDIL